MCMLNIICLIMIGPWSVRNSLKSLGGVSGSCFSGRGVIPWPLLVGVYGGPHLYNSVRIQGKDRILTL